ncbi:MULTISPECIES: glycosyltransferase [unclassified Solwaraspora]|uniref:glycosyltransferase n=1 Tax=unclassified Solwaraspora TaxID=2627926 RepID=UPI00248AEED5|nr:MULTISPECIES: glycosyltransferase [unclassified Solwaraspora]WBB96738.1 glycosyltransferase [Solwaraspora sp. WMMA2059]WBC19358.1 glycosyltransferase [Solwaraspora sp. WMMA2080]WJK33199.1 glycosyltransferase [Solwaraspora sp. WMMA2065]
MRWLVFGTYEAQRHPRVAVLIEGLRAAGDAVIELNAPLGLDTAGRVAMLRQPWRLPLLAVKLARCWASLAWRARRFRRPGKVDAVLVGYLGHFDVRLARRLFPGTPIVLDHLVSAAGTARDRGLATGGGIKGRLMRAIDDGALGSADLVVVDTTEHAAALPPAAADKGVVALVGAGREWFAARRPDAAEVSGPLRAIFVGLYTPLHGTAVLGAALADLAADESVEVTMVGTGQEYAECRAAAAGNPRVTWIDWATPDELPALVAGHHVALGIFGTTDKALNVVPTKVFQGAAAGCAVLTSDTAPQRRVLGEAAILVPPGDSTAIAAELRSLAADRPALRRWQQAAGRRADESFQAAAVTEPVRQRAGSLTTADRVAGR